MTIVHLRKNILNYYKLLFSPKLFLLKIVALVVFIILAFILLVFRDIGSGLNALPISVVSEPSGSLQEQELYRVSANNNFSPDFALQGDSKFIKKKSYAIDIAIANSALVNIASLSVSIASNTWQFTAEEIRQGSYNKEHDAWLLALQRSSTSSSILQNFYPRIAELINYGLEERFLLKNIIRSLLGILAILILGIPLCFSVVYLSQKIPDINLKLYKGFWLQLLLFVIIVVGSLPLIFSSGNWDVQNSWLAGWWMDNFEEYGFRLGYINTGDNAPPLVFYLLGLLKILSNGMPAMLLILYKSSLLTAALVLSLQLWLVSGMHSTKGFATATISYLSLIIAISHGYHDILYMPFLFLCIFNILNNRIWQASTFYAIAISLKFQPLLFAPIILIFLLNEAYRAGQLKHWYRSRIILEGLLPSLLVIVFLSIYFGIDYPFNILKSFVRHPELNYGALNLGFIIDKLGGRTDPSSILLRSVLLFIKPLALITFLLILLLNYFIATDYKKRIFLDLLVAVSVVYFLFKSGVHQNHMLIAFVPILYILLYQKQVNYKFYLALFWLIYQNINLLLDFPVSPGLYSSRFSGEILVYMEYIVIVVAIILCAIYVLEIVSSMKEKIKSVYK